MQATSTSNRALSALQDYYAGHRAMPSFGALAKRTGVSVSTIAEAVGRLKTLSYLRANDTGRLQPGKRFFERQLLGSVQAGFPAEAAELHAEGMLIDEYLVDQPARTFLLTVRGESMRDAGLLPGDTLVVERGAIPMVGDIVVAMLTSEMTVKQLAQREGGGPLFLRARNPDFPDLQLTDAAQVVGVVVGQFRRYAKV